MEVSFNFISFWLFLAFVVLLIKQWRQSKHAKLPPSPWKLPVIGNMHNLIGSPPHHALRKLAQKHGPLMHLQLGEISTIVVSSSRFAQEIMKTHDLAFANRAQVLSGKIICYDCTDIGFCPYGDYWKQMRKICTQELLSPKNVQAFGSIRQDEGLCLVKSIQTLAGTQKPINLTKKLSQYTSSMVSRAAFGKISKDDQFAFLEQMEESMPISSAFEISDLFPSFKILHPLLSKKNHMLKIRNEIDKILDKIIDQHIEKQARRNMSTRESGQDDLIDVLIRIQQKGDLKIPLSNSNIKAVLIDVFTAGTETSSTTIEWAFAEMIRHPHVMAKAQKEIRAAFMGKETIEESGIQELKYLKSIIKETLRLHPPAPLLVPRESREECEIDGYIIPVKTRVLVNAWAISRDPEYWDDPESFKPERFENLSIDFTGSHFQYIPFGAGRRICPGISFGLANVELPLALLLYHFHWKLPNGLNPNDLDMAETIGVAVTRKNNLLLLATLYDSSF